MAFSTLLLIESRPLSFSDAAPRACQGGVHSRDLLRGEHQHCIVVDIVHVIHEHVPVRTVAATYMRKFRLSIIGKFCVRRVVYKIGAFTMLSVSPDVVQVEPVTDFMSSGSSEVERRGRCPPRSKSCIENHHTIGLRRSARELGISQKPSSQRTDPKVQIFLARPGI